MGYGLSEGGVGCRDLERDRRYVGVKGTIGHRLPAFQAGAVSTLHSILLMCFDGDTSCQMHSLHFWTFTVLTL